jgi:hypothetical protein
VTVTAAVSANPGCAWSVTVSDWLPVVLKSTAKLLALLGKEARDSTPDDLGFCRVSGVSGVCLLGQFSRVGR